MLMTEVNLPTAALIQDLLSEQGWQIKIPLEFENLHVEQHGERWIYHISLRRSETMELPGQLLLKTRADSKRESQFYIDTMGRNCPIPRCFAARTGSPSLVLMEDLSASHSNLCDWPDPLPQQATREVMEALARMHAAAWDFSASGLAATPLPEFLTGRSAYQTFVDHLRRDTEIYLSALGGMVQPARQRLITSVLAHIPDLWDMLWEPRLRDKKALPVIHGDLNPCNILYPHQAGGKVVILDWEAYRRGLPTSDLAMLLGLHLCPEQEEVTPYLSAYHSSLEKAGVRGYAFGSLLEDYQTALLFELFYPIKLYSHYGIHDQTMMDNAVYALESFSDAVF